MPDHVELLTLPQAVTNLNTNAANTQDAQSQTFSSTFQHALSKIQGQKWQSLFDFDKILKQLNHAEKRFLRGNCASSGCRNNFPHEPATLTSPPRSPTTRCTKQMHQVQRLNGQDMHYYGVAPLQESRDIVVCSYCSGTYTKMGLSNHMMLHHPQELKKTPLKAQPTSESYALSDSSQDNSRQLFSTDEISALTAKNEISTSKSEKPIKHYNCKPTTSAALNIYVTPSVRQKSTKSKSGSGGRSRNKKQTSTSKTVVSAATIPPKLEAIQPKSTKGHSKRNSKVPVSSAAISVPLNVITAKKETCNSRETVVPIVLYSSSSNSSCSLPSTPKLPTTVVVEKVKSSLNHESGGLLISAAHSVKNDGKDKLSVVSITKPKSSTSSKKKSKSVSSTIVEPIDSSATISSHEFKGAMASVSTLAGPSKSGSHVSTSSRGVKLSKKRASALQAVTVAKESIVSTKESTSLAAQVSELDQAVSSITKSLMKSGTAAEAPIITKMITQQEVQPASSFQNQMLAPMATSTEESLPPHNTSDDNSILTLEDMLDSKFINEILSTAESDINFDETELESSNHQNFLQQPANKRMRFEDTAMLPVHQQVPVHQQPQQLMPGVVTGDFAIYPQQQQQHYTQYNTGNIENIKLFNNGNIQQVAQIDAQYQSSLANTIQQQHSNQSQLTTIDAMQLQQLLYQQQDLNSTYGTDAIDSQTTSAIQQQQFSMCIDDVIQKPKDYDVEEKLMEYTTEQEPAYEQNMTGSSIADAATAAAHFNVFNIPSLTDEISTDDPENMLPNLVNNNMQANGTQQYVLPSAGEGQVIYEITDNNQVAVMSQQRQQQVIAEFLTQAGYGSVENVNVTQNLTENKNLITDNATTDFWDDGIDDFDCTKIETVKSLSGTNSSNSNEFKGIKSESMTGHSATHHTKNLEDFYNNVYLYAGIPRPLALNNFGLVKLPQSVSTTFKKHLLTTRKAYNSPFTLNGNSAGGMSCNSARFSSTNAKGVNNYFSNTPQAPNEFLIGNITISNTPNVNNNHQHQILKQDGIEITVNTNAQNNRVRQKGTLVVPGGVAASNNKAKFIPTTALSPALGTSPSTRGANNLISVNTKNINASNFGTAINSSERVKFIKRPFLTKLDIPKNSNSAFSAKKIADILNGNSKSKSYLQHNLAVQEQPHSDTVSPDIRNNDMTEQNKRNRVQNFFEKRQKLLSITNNNHPNNNSHINMGAGGAFLRQPQLLKQQLMRTLSDYSVNSIAQCKVSSVTNNKSNSNSNNNDMMRVFV